MALASFIFGSQFRFFGELVGSTQTVWLGERMSQSWALIALMFSVAYTSYLVQQAVRFGPTR